MVYLAYRKDQEGFHPVANKVTAIEQTPASRNITDIRANLGMLNYYHRFLPNISALLEPLYHYLKKEAPWNWGKKTK